MYQFTNTGYDESNVLVGNCRWCGIKGVNIVEHVCNVDDIRGKHPTTQVSELVNVTNMPCLTCINTACEPLNPCEYKPAGVTITKVEQTVAIEKATGYVKAWLGV